MPPPPPRLLQFLALLPPSAPPGAGDCGADACDTPAHTGTPRHSRWCVVMPGSDSGHVVRNVRAVARRCGYSQCKPTAFLQGTILFLFLLKDVDLQPPSVALQPPSVTHRRWLPFKCHPVMCFIGVLAPGQRNFFPSFEFHNIPCHPVPPQPLLPAHPTCSTLVHCRLPGGLSEVCVRGRGRGLFQTETAIDCGKPQGCPASCC